MQRILSLLTQTRIGAVQRCAVNFKEFAMRRRFARKPPCAEIGPGDGVDPRLDNTFTPRRVVNRKALQLSGQVARTLASVLSGECGDDRLRDLLVESVQPAPDSARLLVTVYPGPAFAAGDTESVLRALHGATAMLRAQITRAIHRKRVPELVFQVLGDAPEGSVPPALKSTSGQIHGQEQSAG
jgi:ribosome-binding factor A